MSRFRVLDGCPCPAQIAAYFAILRQDTGCRFNSIYRGSDPQAVRILHAHGKHTQAELYRTLPKGVANPPGYSSHEGFSDGNSIFRTRRGEKLEWWQQGIDVDDHYVKAMKLAAARRGWKLVQPYPSGVEYHHLCFARKPKPMGPKTYAKLIHLRATLPRK
jgi:hypothetical protein